MIGKTVLVPYLRLFPIWKYGPRYDRLDGRYIDDGWSAEVFGQREFETEAEALAWRESLKAKSS